MNARTQSLLVLGLALSSTFASCATTDPAFLTREGRYIRDVPPIAWRIAIAPVHLADAVLQQEDDNDLSFALGKHQLQERLVRDLRAVNTACEVFRVSGKDLQDARQHRADLLLRPRVTAVRIRHQGASSGYLLSSFLWLTTWVGGMFVNDSDYDARLEIEWDLVNPYDNRSIDTRLVSSEGASLRFWQRNNLLSFGTLQSLVLPPVLTSDNDDVTSKSLSDLATARVAARLAGYLKSDFSNEVRETLGACRFESPRNGTTVRGPVRLKGRIVAREPITEVNIYRNDESQPVLTLDTAKLPGPSEQRRGSMFHVLLEQQIAVQPGRNLLSVEFAVKGTFTSRTLLVHAESTTTPKP